MGPGVQTGTEDECKEERSLKKIQKSLEVYTHVEEKAKRLSRLGGA